MGSLELGSDQSQLVVGGNPHGGNVCVCVCVCVSDGSGMFRWGGTRLVTRDLRTSMY